MIQEPDFAEVFQHNPQFATIKKLYDQDRWLFEHFIELLIEESDLINQEFDEGKSIGYNLGREEGMERADRVCYDTISSLTSCIRELDRLSSFLGTTKTEIERKLNEN